MTNFHLEHILV